MSGNLPFGFNPGDSDDSGNGGDGGSGVPGPFGAGAVVVTGNVAQITVNWRPPSQSATDLRRYVTEVLIP